jgi:hypothetical protein
MFGEPANILATILAGASRYVRFQLLFLARFDINRIVSSILCQPIRQWAFVPNASYKRRTKSVSRFTYLTVFH